MWPGHHWGKVVGTRTQAQLPEAISTSQGHTRTTECPPHLRGERKGHGLLLAGWDSLRRLASAKHSIMAAILVELQVGFSGSVLTAAILAKT